MNVEERLFQLLNLHLDDAHKNSKLLSCFDENLLSLLWLMDRSITIHPTRKKEKIMGKGDNSKKNDKKDKKPKQDKKGAKPDAKK